jgi:hypothetical protein
MNKYLKNFYDLYSEDDQVCYRAILEKKDWLFRKLYIPVSFDKVVEDGKDLYKELYALMDSSFIFKSMYYNKEVFLDTHYEDCLQIINAFNNQFRYLHLYEELDFTLGKDIFFVEIDPFKMDDKVYKDLVSNFYPCFNSPTDLELKYDKNQMIELLKLPMINNHGYVLILAKDVLLNDRYYLPIIKKLHYSKRIGRDKIEAIEEIANSLQVEVKKHD